MNKIAFFALMLALGLVGGCGNKKEEKKEEKDLARISQKQDQIEVKAAKARLAPFEMELVSNGKVNARRKAVLAFITNDVVRKVHVKNGERVKKGDPIVSVDELKAGQQLEAARLSWEKAKLELRGRLMNEGINSLEDTLDERVISKTRLENIKLQIGYTSAVKEYEKAVYDYSNITVYAPFDGVIADLEVKEYTPTEGSYLSQLSSALRNGWTGFVSGNYDGGTYANEVALKDEMLLMEETIINDTFLDTTPQELISYFLAQAGLSKMKLSSKTYPTRKMLPIRRQTAVQAINTVNAAWGLRVPFFFSGGVFYWDEKPEQKKVYTFERGVNILNLRRAGGVWELETVSAPFIKHSHKINLIHPQVSGEVEVSKVVSKTNDSGFIRTYIYF